MKTLALVSAISALAILAACEKKPIATPAKNEAAKTFDATTRYLEQGGDVYLYLRTEQILEKLPAKMDSVKSAVTAMAGSDLPLPTEQIDAWYGAAKTALLDTGLTQVRAFGMSSVELEPGLHRTHSVVYTGENNDPGMLLKLGGNAAPHAFDMLDFLPSTAVYVVTSDFDATALWSYLSHVIESVPDAAVRAQAQQFPAIAEAALGMSLNDFTASLGTEMGIVICADESQTMTIPAGTQPLEIPRLTAALLFRVNDDRLYDLLAKKLEENVGAFIPLQKSDADGVRSVTVNIPANGLPVAPTIARFGNYVTIATTNELVQQLARKGGTPPTLLKDTEVFKRFASREKMEGNSLCLIAERGSDILRKIQLQSIREDKGMPPQFASEMEKLYDLFSQRFVFSIGRHEKDAMTGVMYSPRGSEQILAAAVVIPAGILAGIAVPNIAMIQQRQRQNQEEAEQIEALRQKLQNSSTQQIQPLNPDAVDSEPAPASPRNSDE